MRKHILVLIVLVLIIIFALTIWYRGPIWGYEWNKQTLYVGLLNTLYGPSTDNKAYAMWIDDDSTEGIFKVKRIADDVGITPNFAVIADMMDPKVADSLVSWQHQGAGIILHGLRHERWKYWDASQIGNDIRTSLRRLHEQGFDTTKILKIIMPAHGSNTSTIRDIIKQQGCHMISGARLVNPDRHVFQYGRIGITMDTNIDTMHRILRKAYKKNAFIIFATHSSIPDNFSEEKTKEVMRMAKEMGFCFDIYE